MKTSRLIKQVVTFAMLLSAGGASAAGLSAEEERLVTWIDTHAEDAISLIEETVNIGSGTMNHEGVRIVGRVLRRELDALGLESEWVDLPSEVNRAGHLFGRKDGNGPKFLLIGHLDTVFEADDDFQSFERDGDTARGPGVNDMKSGNVVIVYALKALAEIGVLQDIPVVVAFTGDEEEVGQPLSMSRHHLVEAGKWADISLGFESSVNYGNTDWATIARRSSSNWLLEVSGRQAHSSGIFDEDTGAGAIFEAARILHEFYDEVRGEDYLTFNAGTIQGGTDVEYDPAQTRGSTFGKRNVVPRSVIVHGGIRTISQDQLERARAAMRAVVARNLPHTQASITFTDRYPPMAPTEGNKRLLLKLSDVNEALGRGPMPALDPSERGAADISFVAPYTDGIAGLGADGSGAHTPNESVDLTSIPIAIKRVAILIYRLSAEAEVARRQVDSE